MQIKIETVVGLFILISFSAFLYMGYKIGFFKFNKSNYLTYYVNFKNISGLTKKADVKIAGFKVGWVDDMSLSQNGSEVIAKLMILNKYILPIDTKAYIKQDSLLSIKFVDIVPGTSNEILDNGQFLNKGIILQQNSMDDMFNSLNKIMTNIVQASESFKLFTNNKENFSKLKDILENIAVTTENIKKFSNNIENLLSKNEIKLDKILKNLDNILIETPEKIKSDIKDSADSIKSVANNINNLSQEIKNSKLFKSVINKNEPLIENVTNVLSNTKTFVEGFRNITLGVDNNYQAFFEKNKHKNFESLLNFWFHPNDYFYLLGGVTYSKDGYLKESKINLANKDLFMQNNNTEKIFKRKLNTFMFNIQTGGYFYNHFGVRIGLFESTPGAALDIYMPLFKDKIRLVSTFEIFDLTGKNQFINDNKPQLRFMNRLFFNPNIYLSFGANNLASHKNLGGFIGLGIDFGDTFFRTKY